MAQNVHNDVTNKYYSGQGVVLIGNRDSVTGAPQSLYALGNVSDLKIGITTTTVDHKGSQDGNRAIDKRLQTETKVMLTIQLQNFIARNLALAMRGANTQKAAGSVTAESVKGWTGGVTGFANVNITNGSLVVTRSGDSYVITEYVDDLTPWDYRTNYDAGSIKLNDQITTFSRAQGKQTLTITAVTGSPTTPVITATHSLQIGDLVTFGPVCVTGANAAAINNQTLQVATIATTVSFTLQQIGGGNVVGTTIVVNASAPLAVCWALQKTATQVLTVSAVTVSTGAGLPTTLTVPNTCVAGDRVWLGNFAGAGGINLNQNGLATLATTPVGGGFIVTSASATQVQIAKDTNGQTITCASGASMWVTEGTGITGFTHTVAYSYSAQNYVDSLTTAPPEFYMRFEGLNTADTTITGGIATYSPVVVEVWKFQSDPLKELAMISDAFGDFVMEGMVLADNLKSTGSKFFVVKKLG